MTSLGRVAFVNLTTGEVEIGQTPPALVEKFLGGRGLNMAYLRRLLPLPALHPRGAVPVNGGWGPDPLGPDNPLIIGAGLLTGALAPNASRWNVTARSPETGYLGDSNCGGFFGAEMRRAGFDRLIVLGRAERPTYIHLEDGRVELHDATPYWGLPVQETQVQLREDLGKDVEVACIGPAGEHQVRFAAVMTGIKDAAGRCGLGAVMGSKNLKAVTAYGSLGVPVADPRGLFDYCLELKAYLQRSKITAVLGRVGTPLLYEVSNRLGAIRTRNSQDNYFEDTLNAEEIERYSEKMLSCAGCLVHCRHRNTLGGEGPEYSTIGLLGANCGLAPTDQVITLNNQVNDLGLDASSAGTILAWAMELYQRGLIDRNMTGAHLEWGDYETVRQLLEDIAYRRGFGDILAESTQALRYFPPEAKDYLIAVKNLPQSDPHDVRYIKAFALGIAVASRGADHLRNRPTLEIFKLPERLVTEIYGQPVIQDPTSYETKGVVVAFSDDIYATIDSLGLCKFICHGFNSPHLLKYEHFAKLIRLITGLELSPEEVRQVGRRVVDLERMINADFGLTAADDTLPRRYFEEPMPARTTKGHRIEREGFAAMRADYYAQRGWDAEGRVPPERAAELDGLVKEVAMPLPQMAPVSRGAT